MHPVRSDLSSSPAPSRPPSRPWRYGAASPPTADVLTADVPTADVLTADVPTADVPTADLPTSPCERRRGVRRERRQDPLEHISADPIPLFVSGLHRRREMDARQHA